MKKTLKVLLAVVITPIALFLILTLLLYCHPVQKWAVEKAAQVASEKTGMRIIPRNCDFSHFLYLEVGIRLIGSDSHVLIK